MAKKAASIFEPTDPMQDFQQFEVEQFFNEVSPNISVVHFHRMYPDGRRPQIGKATLEVIREDVYEFVRTTYVPKYGGGKYLMIARGEGSRYLGARQIEVDGMSDGTPTNNNGANTSTGFNEEKIPFHDRLLLYSMMRPQAQPMDFGAIMAGIAAMMTALKPAESKPIDPMQTFRDMMTMYQTMKDKNEKPPLEQLREVASVIKEFSADGGKEETMWGAITSVGKDVVEKVVPILGNITQSRAGVAPGVPVAPRQLPGPSVPMIPAGASPGVPTGLPAGTVMAGGPAIPTPVAAPPLPSGAPTASVNLEAEENLRKWLAAQIALLKAKAKAGKDPGFWIDYFFENEEEPGCQAVFYAIRQGATLENLMAFDPEIGQDMQLTAWFREVFNGVRTGLFQGPVDSGGPGGNPRDDSANAPVVPSGPIVPRNSGVSVPLPDTDVH